jgi:hypothetical protein
LHTNYFLVFSSGHFSCQVRASVYEVPSAAQPMLRIVLRHSSAGKTASAGI